MIADLFWKIFNFVGRIFGVLMIVVGMVIEFSYVLLWIDEGSGFKSEYTTLEKGMMLIFPVIAIVLGWLILKSKPFYPKL